MRDLGGLWVNICPSTILRKWGPRTIACLRLGELVLLVTLKSGKLKDLECSGPAAHGSQILDQSQHENTYGSTPMVEG